MDKRQVLALLGGEVFCRVKLTPAIRFSCSFAPRTKEARMNVRYRVELSQLKTKKS